MKRKLIKSMKAVFGDDQKRIDHTLAVLKYAEQIYAAEGGDWDVIVAAAILHDIGIHQAELKYDSAAGKYQEIEGPSIAGGILVKYGMSSEKVEHVCRIIASHHSAKDIDTLEFRIIWDSDWLVNIPDECGKMSKDKLKGFIKKIFRTKKGKELAKERYLSGD